MRIKKIFLLTNSKNMLSKNVCKIIIKVKKKVEKYLSIAKFR